MFGMGVQELLIILFIVLLLFGAKKLPGLANSLGSSVAEFKKGLKGPAEADKNDKVIDARNDSADAVPKQKSDANT